MKRRKAFRGAVLVGFMGAGKSAVGKELARRLGAGFVDLDKRLEKAAGKAVREIFSEAGEAGFREMESSAIRDVVNVPGRVIAVGGGAFVDAGNRERLKSYGSVIHLEVSPETVLERLEGDHSRPLLLVPRSEREKTVRKLIAGREAFYRMADFAVPTDGRTVIEVVDRIVELLRSGPEGGR